MHVRPTPGVTATILQSGELLLRPGGGETRIFPKLCAAMWIALRQHGGDIDRAAAALAAMWNSESVIICAELEIWVDELRAEGLVGTTA
ncbi:PqqD family protein [Streptomyces sp. MS06]|uniref:PqqD family protein n=1 Tax=Streptomyces sp. MS06 TaxID=3385974 RepID=UPI0039A3CA18